MKNLSLFVLGFLVIIASGCDKSRNFMDVDNPNAKENLINLVGSGNIPKFNTDNIIPENLSGTWDAAKGYANRYYEDALEGYVNVAKDGLSGATQTLKGFYNEGVDQLNGVISDKVNGVISGELNKIKLK